MYDFLIKFLSLPAYIIDLDELTRIPMFLLTPFLKVSSKSPPCAPTPGINKKLSGTIVLTSFKNM